jgi:hypothetical protein
MCPFPPGLGLPDAQRSKLMRRILQQEVIPALRDLGFRGTMPHFNRQRGDRLDLFSIQFSYNGQYFFVNLGRLQLLHDASTDLLKPTKQQLNLAYCPVDQRTRLTNSVLSERLAGRARPALPMWDFTAESDAQADDLMHRLAHQLREYLPLYADPWWRDEKLKADQPLKPAGPGLVSS